MRMMTVSSTFITNVSRRPATEDKDAKIFQSTTSAFQTQLLFNLNFLLKEISI